MSLASGVATESAVVLRPHGTVPFGCGVVVFHAVTLPHPLTCVQILSVSLWGHGCLLDVLVTVGAHAVLPARRSPCRHHPVGQSLCFPRAFRGAVEPAVVTVPHCVVVVVHAFTLPVQSAPVQILPAGVRDNPHHVLGTFGRAQAHPVAIAGSPATHHDHVVIGSTLAHNFVCLGAGLGLDECGRLAPVYLCSFHVCTLLLFLFCVQILSPPHQRIIVQCVDVPRGVRCEDVRCLLHAHTLPHAGHPVQILQERESVPKAHHRVTL